MMHRTHTCGALRVADIGSLVTLCGWVQRVRNKGKMVWVDVRDRYGVTQLVIEEPYADKEVWAKVQTLGREYVLAVRGEVLGRVTANPKLATGGIEVRIDGLEILNTSLTPPFLVEDKTDGHEELRMQYRYLDLRRACLQRNLVLRGRLMALTRDYLGTKGFLELDTPMLIRSTPEGARDFVVPARREKGHFYALPQSPQLLKQLLMVGGMDRYFQFARCFRDEDLRADRQPEFTQLDCELSFVSQEDVLGLFEGLMKMLFEEVKGVRLPDFGRMGYEEAMGQYGSDKPDVRFGMRLQDLTEAAGKVDCPLWRGAELVAGVVVKGGERLSRKALDAMGRLVAEGAWEVDKMTYVRFDGEGCRSPLTKWYDEASLQAWGRRVEADAGDVLVLVGGPRQATQEALGALRLHVIEVMEVAPACAYAPLWVVDFPLLTWDSDARRYHAKHHPFTLPKEEDIPLLGRDPAGVRAHAYDLVVNGVEVGGGSLRIHRRDVQEKVLEAIGMDPRVAAEQFGALLSALDYGAPPHGGIALGWERLCLLMGGGDSIRDYMPFPKNNGGRDVMLGAPAPLVP